MAAKFIEPLDDDEAYLWAILSDPSGMDQMEFSIKNAEEEDGIFRAWPFQWKWWRCVDQKQIEQAARSLGKSWSIRARAYAFPFIHPDEEMVITAPEGVHLDAITDVVETAFGSNRLGREMMTGGRGGVKHRPFHANFQNGARIMGRIPQRDGKGMKGTHPVWLEMDEAQDYPKPGWTEVIETLKSGSKGSVWRAHGVTRGVRDHFHKFTQDGSGWTVHRYTAMSRPTWTDSERQSKIELYGSKDHPDYRRNVLGLHGDATNPLFVLHRLMKVVDQDPASDFNDSVYTKIKVNSEMVIDNGDDILSFLNTIPYSHSSYKHVWIGADIGFTNDPTEILVFNEEKVKNGQSNLRLVTRITLDRISNPKQVEVILWLINFYKPHSFSMDKTGVGLPLFQEIQDQVKKAPGLTAAIGRINGYGFSEKILVDFDDSIVFDEFDTNHTKAEMYRNVLEYSTDCLRKLVDSERIILPWDKEIIAEFQGQTYENKASLDMYGRKRSFSTGSFHTLDAARMAALGYFQFGIEQMTKEPEYTPITPIFL